MSTPQQLDTNCMTLTRFVLNHQRNHPEATGVFTDLINALGTSVKAISSSVRKAGLAKLHGITGELNVQGEEVKKLDVLANDLFINMLTASYSCQLMVSLYCTCPRHNCNNCDFFSSRYQRRILKLFKLLTRSVER